MMQILLKSSLFCLLIILSYCNCEESTTHAIPPHLSNSTLASSSHSRSPIVSQNVSVNPNQVVNFKFSIPGARLLNAAKWIRGLASDEHTFIGRCFGAARRLKMIMPFLLFKLGVIVTTLAFLTIFSLKGLTIGVVLLVLNAGTIFSKLALLKHAMYHHEGPKEYYVPHYPRAPPVHLHVHKDHDHGHYAPTAWADRISQGLSKTNNLAERVELIKLYRRLGLDVDTVLNEGGFMQPDKKYLTSQGLAS